MKVVRRSAQLGENHQEESVNASGAQVYVQALGAVCTATVSSV